MGRQAFSVIFCVPQAKGLLKLTDVGRKQHTWAAATTPAPTESLPEVSQPLRQAHVKFDQRQKRSGLRVGVGFMPQDFCNSGGGSLGPFGI
jgi:hypothetical protein